MNAKTSPDTSPRTSPKRTSRSLPLRLPCLLRLLWLCTALVLLGPGARADDTLDVDTDLDTARLQIEQIKKSLDGEARDGELSDFRKHLQVLQQHAGEIEKAQQPLFDSARARLAELGAAPAKGESSDVAEQRRTLTRSSEQLDNRLKLARLLGLESQQLQDQIGDLRRTRFRDRLFERSDSLLAPSFWRELRGGLSQDEQRIASFRQRLGTAMGQPELGRSLGMLALLGVAVALRLALGRALPRLAARLPQGRLRRSLYALAKSVLTVLVPAAAMAALAEALGHDLSDDDPLRRLLDSVFAAVCFSAYFIGLGQALLLPGRPSWRLLPLPDRVAIGLRPYPLLIGAISFAGWLAQKLAGAVPLSLPIEVAINAAYALALGLALTRLVHRGERLRQESLAQGDADAGAVRPAWIAVAQVCVWGLLLLGLLGIVIGYVALGSFVLRQLIWIGVLGLSAYLLATLVEDVFELGLTAAADAADADGTDGTDGSGSPAGERVRRLALRQQLLVLLSGALRLTIWLLVLVLALAPFGESAGDLLQRSEQLRAGIAVGELKLRPTAVLQALVVFLLALQGLRMLKHWFSERFLPTTSLDVGMRSSLTTLLSFLGTILAVGLGLSAIGLGLDRLAWVASALSVGIGFGLQAIVSNFVSGLILLAERPVKVGDWVVLGGLEGDIRRINVRATEIQMGDRSTVIVPNSEFISKAVRNVTHGSPQGLVQIKLPMPLDADVARVSEVLRRAFAEHAGVLDTPAPSVQLDGIADGNVVFNATGFVSSPRQAYGVRSELLFRVLQELREAGVPLWRAPGLVLREPPAPPGPPAPPL
ncbi:MAG: DUF3772 domain-containing protein [Burkholderiaceae bacterium]